MPDARWEFASDNTAGLCPEALAAVTEANQGFAASYGDDRDTAAAADAIREVFEADCDVYFVFNGTAANSLSVATVCQPYHSVVCHRLAHLETDECGAPEFFSHGTKVLLADGPEGKLDPAVVEGLVTARRDIHYPKPHLVSLTESTELGTVYRPEEVAAVAEVARRHGLSVHMDGARFANAVAALGVAPRVLTVDAGVDMLSFGGTKNGMGTAEAVVFFDRGLSAEFAFRCKQAGQLASKMRFGAAPWARMLTDGSWLRHAGHANAMAGRLADGLVAVDVEVVHPVQANAVFARLTEPQERTLRQAGFKVHPMGGGLRFMCSWATTPALVDEVVATIAAAG